MHRILNVANRDCIDVNNPIWLRCINSLSSKRNRYIQLCALDDQYRAVIIAKLDASIIYGGTISINA